MDYQLTKEELRNVKFTREEFQTLDKVPIVCILDNLQNGYNIGVIIRLCESLRITSLYICGSTPTLKSKKVLKTATGVWKWLNIIYCDSTIEAINEVKKANYTVYGVELAKKSISYLDISYPKKCAFVFSNERYGMNEAVLSKCESSIHIPMYGMGNSINVSSCASIIMANAFSKINT